MAMPGSPSSKKPKSSCLLYLLIATLIGICLCAAVILYLTVLRTPETDGPDAHFQNGTILPSNFEDETSTAKALTTTSPFSTSSVSSTSSTSSTSPSSSTTQPTSTSSESSTTSEVTSTTTTAQEIVLPVDVDSILKDQNKDFEIVEKCALLEAIPVSCAPSQKDSATKPTPSDFKPIHYNLNLTIRDVRKPVLEGFIQIFATTKSQTTGITIHASKIHNLDNREKIRLLNCNTGETICISKVQHLEGDGMMFLETAQLLEPQTNIRLDLDGFISADSGPNVYKQIPTAKWRVPTMVGSVFEPTSARSVFPSFDSHNQKASLNLCLTHGPSMTAISNSMISSESQQISGVSCFDKTVPLTSQQMSFVAFEKTSSLFYNRTTVDGVYLPEIEMVFNLNNNFKPQQYEWIFTETSKVMALLSKWSAFSYPLNRLSVVVAPVMIGHSALGVITLPAQAVAYQKHTSTHETLIKEVIGQWMEGVVTTEHTCFEKALITYLEWKVNEELQIVKKTRKSEILKIRPRNLNETQDQLRVIRNVLPSYQQHQKQQQSKNNGLCSPRFVEVFYTLDETYGVDTVIGIIRVIFDKFAFSTAAISDWQEAAEKATGRVEAGKLIEEWFSRPLSRPIFRAHVQSQAVEFEQLTNETWSVPLEIAGSAGTQLAVITERKQSIPFVSSDFVVVDPSRKSHAFIVYDADTYLRLIRCFGDSRCPSKEIGGVFADLAAALIANVLPAPEKSDIAKWKSVFKFMAQQNLVEGTAACCVEHAIREMRKCSYWDIQDVCTKIQFNTVLAAVA